MDFAQLKSIESKIGSKVSVSDSVAKEINEMNAIEENSKRDKQRRLREKAITAEINAKMDARQNKFGTADVGVADTVAGKGPFNPSFAALAQMDPQAAKLELAEVESALGRGKEAEPPQKFYKGVQKGASGDVPYFTNFPDLKDQSVATQVPANVVDLQEYKVEGKTRGLGGSNADNPELEQKFRMAHEQLEAPAKHAKAVTELSYEASARARGDRRGDGGVGSVKPGVEYALNWLDNLSVSGETAKRGLAEADIQRVGADLLKRARTADKLPIGSGYLLPLTEQDATPGIASDKVKPATILNPGGGPTSNDQLRQRTDATATDMDSTIDASAGQAVPRTADYAARRVQKSQPSQVETGGTGGSVFSDVNAFLEGKGRAGYGESGPKGLAKDIAGFYGPRLPVDLATVLFGVKGVGKVGKGLKEAKKLRSIGNIFGEF